MKLIYFAGLLFLGLVFCRNIDDKVDKGNQVDQADEDLFKIDLNDAVNVTNKCKQVGGEAAGKKFTDALETTVSCLNKQIPRNKEVLKQEINSDATEETFICSKRRKALRGCFVELIEALKDCSVEQEKYAPEFLFDALDTLLDFLCNDNGKALKDLNSKESWECGERLIEKIAAGNLTTTCTDRFKLLHSNDDDIVTKPELCEDLSSAKTCYVEVLNRECPDAKALNVWLAGVFDAVSSPCKSAKTRRHIIN